MFRLALASLRFRFAASVAMMVTVALGAAILITCGGLFETALRLTAAPQRYAGAPIVVTAPMGYRLGDSPEVIPYTERSKVPVDTIQRITQVPEVAKVIVDHSFTAVIANDKTSAAHTLSGHAWKAAAITPYVLKQGSEPRPGQVAIDTLTAERNQATVGSKLSVVVKGQSKDFTVSGIAEPETKVIAPAFFFSEKDTPSLANPKMADAVAVFPVDGVNPETLAKSLQKVLPADYSVAIGDKRGAAEFIGINGSRLPLLLLAGIFTGMVTVVMLLVVSATTGLSIRQRQREIALLRASGATPKQVRRLVVVETMVVATIAAGIGISLASTVGNGLFSLTTSRNILPTELHFYQGWMAFVGGTVITWFATWITVRTSARAAAATNPIQAITESSLPDVKVSALRRGLAVAFAAATVILASTTLFFSPDIASATGGPAALTGVIAVGLVAPEVLAKIMGMIAQRREKRGNGISLPLVNVRSRAGQLAAVLTPLTIAVAIALGNVYSQTTHSAAVIRDQLSQFQVDAVISSTAGGLTPQTVTQVRSISDVQAASGMVTSQGWIEKPYDKSHTSDPWQLLGISAQADNGVLTTPVKSGSLQKLTGNTVALPEQVAKRLHLKLGDTITMRLGDGAQPKVTVVALLGSTDHNSPLILPLDLLAAHTTSGLVSQVLVRSQEGKTAEVRHQLQQLAQGMPGAQAGDRDDFSKSFTASLGIEAWINYLLAAVVIAYAAIASVNTLMVVILSRRQEFALQRLAGATRKQVRKMLWQEGLLLSATALAVGGVISLFTTVPIAFVNGWLVPMGPLWVTFLVAAAVIVISWIAITLAARMALKSSPIEILSSPDE